MKGSDGRKGDGAYCYYDYTAYPFQFIYEYDFNEKQTQLSWGLGNIPPKF